MFAAVILQHWVVGSQTPQGDGIDLRDEREEKLTDYQRESHSLGFRPLDLSTHTLVERFRKG